MTKGWWPDSFRWRACYAPEKLGEPVLCQRCGGRGEEIVNDTAFCADCYSKLAEELPFVREACR